MEWDAPALVLSRRPYGEADVIVRLFYEEHGVLAGLVRGGASRKQSSLWLPGNLVASSWRARLPTQLGYVTGEPIQSIAGRLLDSPLALALLASEISIADGGLPEHEAQPVVFAELVRLVTAIGVFADAPPVALAVRWEASLLAALGYGLTLDRCAITGDRDDLGYVSPRTGRAVSRAGAGQWIDRLLPLPSFMISSEDDGTPSDWLQGLQLTGHFLARHLFGVRHLPLPEERERLVHLVRRLSEESYCQPGG